MAVLPALNGHTGDADPAERDDKDRVWATLPKSQIEAIDAFWHANRLKTRSAAIEALIGFGLRTAPFRKLT